MNSSFDAKAPDCYKIDNKMLEGYFAQPPNIFRMVQYLNSRAPDSVLDTYRDFNIGGILAFLDQFLYAIDGKKPEEMHRRIEYARKNGFHCWLGDDFGYPSGLGGGYTVKGNPEYQVRGLVCVPFDGSGSASRTFTVPEEVEEALHAVVYPVENGAVNVKGGIVLQVKDGSVTVRGMCSDWKCCIFGLQVIDKDSQPQSTIKQFGHDGRYPDLTRPDAVKKFIQVMHKKYMDELKKTGTEIEGFYTNEPSLAKMYWRTDGSRRKYPFQTWNKYVADEFRKMHGYDIRPKLIALYGGDSLEEKRIRIHYYQTVGELFSRNFAGQITRFCREHGVKSGGHYLLNENMSMHVAGYGDLMKFTAAWDIPGLDIGIPKSRIRETFPYHQTKFFSSASCWNGSDTTTMLLDPIIGGSGRNRLSPAIPVLRNSVNMGYLYGANKMSTYVPLSPRDKKGGKATGYDKQEYRDICDYIGRIAVMLRGAKNNTSVGVYYPIAAFQSEFTASPFSWRQTSSLYQTRQESFDDTMKVILNAGLDFNMLHPEAVAEARVVDGAMMLGDHAYLYLVMPQMDIMPLAVMKKVRRLERSGGTVLWVDYRPVAAERAENQAAFMRLVNVGSVVGHSGLVDRLKEPYDPEFSLNLLNDSASIGIARFNRNDQKLYYLVNRKEEPQTARVDAPKAIKTQCYDPFSGEITPVSMPAKIKLESYGSVILSHL